MELTSARVLWDMVDGPMPRGLLGIGSGDLVVDGATRTLLLGGYSTGFRNRIYAATAEGHEPPSSAAWRIGTDRTGRARPLVIDPPRDAWDGGGLHTPSHLPATATAPERIYYAGRAGRRHVGAGSRYAIGVLERRDGAWLRRDAPIVTGDPDRPSVLEPRAVREHDRTVLWYLATPHEVARGELPDYELRCVVSVDGLTGWSEPVAFSTPDEGFFDLALAPSADGWTMVLAAGTNLHRTKPYPPQGLWRMTAATASPRRADWTAPQRLLDTDAASTPAWMGAGVCDPALFIEDDGALTVFVTGTRRYGSWPGLALERLRRLRRPPVPAPFQLATGVLRFE